MEEEYDNRTPFEEYLDAVIDCRKRGTPEILEDAATNYAEQLPSTIKGGQMIQAYKAFKHGADWQINKVNKLLDKLADDCKHYKQYDDKNELRITEEFISLIKQYLL